MPRSKEGKKRDKVDKENLERAVMAVENHEISFREASKVYEVKVATLHRHVKSHIQRGKQQYEYTANNAVKQVFSNQMELELLSYVKQAALMHYGLNKNNMRKLAYQFAKENNVIYPQQWDENQLAGVAWLRGFVKKYSNQISLRKPEATSLARSTSFNRANVQTFFTNLKRVYAKYGPFEPHQIYNVDETGMTTVHVPPKILAPRGIKQLGSVTSGERGQNVTLIAGINAIGNHLPPMFVFPRVHFKEFMLKGAPVGSKGGANQSGWSNEKLFLEWLDFFIEHARPSKEKPVLLILDNHESHVSVAVIEKARVSGIKMLTFPPHTSHRLQPLDRTVFGSFKSHYNRAVNDWMSCNPGKPLSIYEVAEMVGRAFPLAFTSKNITSGFAASGIVPLNEDIFSDIDFLSSYATDRPNPDYAKNDTEALDTSADSPISPTPAASSSCQAKVSVESIRPFPKAGARKVTSRGRKKGKSTILTETPEKFEVESSELEKVDGRISNSVKTAKKVLQLEESYNKNEEVMSLRGSSDDDDIMAEFEEQELENEIMEYVTGEKGIKDILGLPNVVREIDQHVAFLYQGQVYPGKIVAYDEEGATISSMQKSLKSWKWPEKSDILNYPWTDVLGSIMPPKQISKRGFYAIPELLKLE
ncbi:hypothetical protein PPYR_04330 [Photinus pyralis]|uniref:DDE-1 domain-containing protein n=1 Tax=Photinus pyralis TaxID=7054 RepID=A0A1Y1MAV5_PHOPY|nr:tigger transposable element-derived protein 6-like [Photinus pyralis]XP_031332123.1 tigger transposable element-derived protein 6-like [Photinus pyralis]KAB0802144.1 hypothetical protein PPYR_04330 [Photinus pyralis]